MKKLRAFSLLLGLAAAVAGCVKDDVPYNQADFEQGGGDAPYLNERTMTFMDYDNQYANVDAYKPKTDAEKAAMEQKWNTARKDTRWEEYRGAMVRVEIILGNSDMREMRLHLMQGSNGMDVNGDVRYVLSKVADYEMKKVCGRNADSYVVVYDTPSFDVMRPTPYFDYVIKAEGATMREYGFRCIYNN
jgi:hypothetical protein